MSYRVENNKVGSTAVGTYSGNYPYIKRDAKKGSLGYRIVAKFESIPILKSVVALVKSIIAYLQGKCFKKVAAEPLTLSKQKVHVHKKHRRTSSRKKKTPPKNPLNPKIAKMTKRAVEIVYQKEWDKRAFHIQLAYNRAVSFYYQEPQRSHAKLVYDQGFQKIREDKSLTDVYMTGEEITKSERIGAKNESSLKVVGQCEAEDAGRRESMQDAHGFIKIGEGEYLGIVADGHGSIVRAEVDGTRRMVDSGKDVADYVKGELIKRFNKDFIEGYPDIRTAMQSLVDAIQGEIEGRSYWDQGGCTLVFSYIKGNKIVTATAGDSEAFIGRKGSNGAYKIIPLSVTPDWNDEKPFKRWWIGNHKKLPVPSIEDVDKDEVNVENIRHMGLNVAHAIGDKGSKGIAPDYSDSPKELSSEEEALRGKFLKRGVISHKLMVTERVLIPEDIVFWACDGVMNAIPMKEIAAMMRDVNMDLTARNIPVEDGEESSQESSWNSEIKLDPPKDLAAMLVRKACQEEYTVNDNVTAVAIRIG